MVAVATNRARLPSSSGAPTLTVERTSTRSASRTASRPSSADGSVTTSPSGANASLTYARLRSATMRSAMRVGRGAAWREVKDGPAFENVLDMVRGVRALGLEACTTLGMLTDEQARRLKDAGLTAYNHNLDTSRRHYPSIITTRTYDDRL